MGLRLPGNRIVKTTVAVFLTAYICVLLGWPPVFAVITAIVTLEPTALDSVKKGIVRFPASAIGSFYAVLFIALFGNSPITYTLATALTIITCFRLRLHAGLLVATITAVAMVEVVYDNYLLSFFIRLGTTTTGIVVSTLVNMFILPPNYTKQIETGIKRLYQDLGETVAELANNPYHREIIFTRMKQLKGNMIKTEELIRFQKDQTFFQAFVVSGKETHQKIEEKMEHFRLLHYHLSNITTLRLKEVTFSEENWTMIKNATLTLADLLQGTKIEKLNHHELQVRRLLDLFWSSPHAANRENEAELPHELTFLYELVTMFYLVKQKNMDLLYLKPAPS
jgi:uncharacterized membrane protein YgaE (UPF0421/DUF939 family)